jgi:hypothetical protein
MESVLKERVPVIPPIVVQPSEEVTTPVKPTKQRSLPFLNLRHKKKESTELKIGPDTWSTKNEPPRDWSLVESEVKQRIE